MPLNTARMSCHTLLDSGVQYPSVLAVQNMEASGAIAREQELEFNALEGSLGMMSKGLSHWPHCILSLII